MWSSLSPASYVLFQDCGFFSISITFPLGLIPFPFICHCRRIYLLTDITFLADSQLSQFFLFLSDSPRILLKAVEPLSRFHIKMQVPRARVYKCSDIVLTHTPLHEHSFPSISGTSLINALSSITPIKHHCIMYQPQTRLQFSPPLIFFALQSSLIRSKR